MAKACLLIALAGLLLLPRATAGRTRRISASLRRLPSPPIFQMERWTRTRG